MQSIAFCPGHITGFFKAEITQKQPEFQGSLGAGFCMNHGVTTIVKLVNSNKSHFKIKVIGYETDNTQVSEFVIKEFLKMTKEKFFVDVTHHLSIPVGYGLGSSGAVALSLALALNDAMGTDLSRTQTGQIAHNAEIFCKTGLGTVLSLYYGGFEIRTKQGAPGIGSLKKIQNNSSVIVICFSPIPTKEFIKDQLPRINGMGSQMVNKLLKSRDYEDFLDMSLEFAKYVNVITPTMNSVISELQKNNFKCGVAMFGETVFTLVPKSKEVEVIKILEKYPGIIIQSKIDKRGARLNNC